MRSEGRARLPIGPNQHWIAHHRTTERKCPALWPAIFGKTAKEIIEAALARLNPGTGAYGKPGAFAKNNAIQPAAMLWALGFPAGSIPCAGQPSPDNPRPREDCLEWRRAALEPTNSTKPHP